MKNRGKNIGLLLTGMAAGAALCGGAYAAGIVAQPTWQPIFVDGQQVEMEAYNINGNNYVKLRDIGKEVGFNVYWQNGVQVDSDADYTGEPPTSPEPAAPDAASANTKDLDTVKQEIVDLTNVLRKGTWLGCIGNRRPPDAGCTGSCRGNGCYRMLFSCETRRNEILHCDRLQSDHGEYSPDQSGMVDSHWKNACRKRQWMIGLPRRGTWITC